MKQIELSAGTIDYLDTGGQAPPSLMMDAPLWDDTISDSTLMPWIPVPARMHARGGDRLL